jgi:hypothetical protein
MSVDKPRPYPGFTRTPSRRDPATGTPHRHNGHAEAAAGIRRCVAQNAPSGITGDAGTGRTPAPRATLTDLDPWHTVTYPLTYTGNTAAFPGAALRRARAVPAAALAHSAASRPASTRTRPHPAAPHDPPSPQPAGHASPPPDPDRHTPRTDPASLTTEQKEDSR